MGSRRRDGAAGWEGAAGKGKILKGKAGEGKAGDRKRWEGIQGRVSGGACHERAGMRALAHSWVEKSMRLGVGVGVGAGVGAGSGPC